MEEAPRRRRRRDLSLLPEVPLDVLLEILILLEPKDLLTMSRASKAFRLALVNPTMNNVIWRAKRRESGAPDPPPGYSEAKWVAFLFTSFCYFCAAPNVLTDFYLLKRLCASCKKSEYIINFRPEPEEILDHLMFTQYGPASPKEISDDFYVCDSEFQDVYWAWYDYLQQIASGVAGAVEAFETFKSEKQALIIYMQNHAPECISWVEARTLQKSSEKDALREEKIYAVRARFYELGYADVDVDEVVEWETPELKASKSKLTDRVWKNLRTKLEPQIIEVQERRLYGNELSKNLTRLDILAELYELWKRSLKKPTKELLKYPKIYDLRCLPAVFAITNLDSRINVTEHRFLDIVTDLPNIVKRFIFGRREELRRLVPIENLSEDTGDALELATSVFVAPYSASFNAASELRSCEIAIGWPMLSVAHTYRADPDAEEMGYDIPQPILCEFSPNLSETAASLVKLLGKDPFKTTAEEMDAADAKFVCETCITRTLGHYRNRCDVEHLQIRVDVFGWKEAVRHRLTDYLHPDGVAPTFSLLEEERLIELSDRAEKRKLDHLDHVEISCCNSCFEQDRSGRLVRRSADCVKEHMRITHGMEDARHRNEDCFVHPLARHEIEGSWTIPVVYSLD